MNLQKNLPCCIRKNLSVAATAILGGLTRGPKIPPLGLPYCLNCSEQVYVNGRSPLDCSLPKSSIEDMVESLRATGTRQYALPSQQHPQTG
jgi:hypothetical protein